MEVQVIKRRISPQQQARKDNIIACARQLIMEQGAAVSMEMVAAAAGTSRSTLYRNFSSREHLVADVTLDAGNELIKLLSAIPMPGETVGDNIAWLCEQLARMAKRNTTFLAVCIANLSAEDPAVVDAQEEIEALISRIFAIALGGAVLPDRVIVEQTIFRYLLGSFTLATTGKMTFKAISRDLNSLCLKLMPDIWNDPVSTA